MHLQASDTKLTYSDSKLKRITNVSWLPDKTGNSRGSALTCITIQSVVHKTVVPI